MKLELIIKPKVSRVVTLSCEYFDPVTKKTAYLLRNGDVITDRELLANERVERISFNKNKSSHIITFDWSDNSAAGKSKRMKDERVKAFFERHPSIEVVGGDNKHLISPLFILENTTELTKSAVREIKEKVRICNIINSYDFGLQRDVCYAFGGNPIDMTQEEVYVDLLHPDTGRLMLNWEKFEDMWNKDVNRDIEIIVIAKKAVALGIITTKNNNYCLGGEVIGADSSFESVIAYLKNSQKTFDYVASKVRMEDTYKDFSKKVDIFKKEEHIDTELSETKKRAKELKIKGWGIKPDAQLLVEIEAIESKLASSVKEANQSV